MNTIPVPEFDVIPQDKIAYLTMRKSGCTSIKFAVRERRDSIENGGQTESSDADVIHIDHEFLRTAEHVGAQPWYTFTIVRDPIVRFLSFYGNKILDQNVSGNSTLHERARFGYQPNMRLDHAIDILLDDRFETEPHVFRQSDVIDSVGFDLDFVGRLETLEAEFGAIQQGTGVKLKLSHKNRRDVEYQKINETQFDKLASYYRSDQLRFGYETRFDDWMSWCVQEQRLSFCDEFGFTFKGEAKLVDYFVERQRERYLIELTLRVEATQSRNLWIQVVSYDPSASDGRLVWLSMETTRNLLSECDSKGYVTKRLGVRFEKLPADVKSDQMFVEVFFWTDELEGAVLEHYPGKRIPLALPGAVEK